MLERFLKGVIREGRLTVRLPSGRLLQAGRSDDPAAPDVAVRLRGALTPLKLAVNPDLYLGEAFMAGDLALERGSLWDLMDLIGRNLERRSSLDATWLGPARRTLRRWLAQAISPLAARDNAAHHYDLSLDLYREFLDSDLQYSCAYFARPDASLEEAQLAKKRHIIAKLRLRPGDRVLDIGCGWGGLALEMARTEDVSVTGVTLSAEQLKVCQARAAGAGLADRVKFELSDYREVQGQFDRIVSVGMFEHVGAASYDAFFACVRERLADDGVALVHSIGQRGQPHQATNPWIEKHIFPGGYIPSVSEIAAATERTGLWITDLEILRLHYAETLRRWRERFLSSIDVVRPLYGERFCRMWEFYLAACEMSFRHGRLMVVQTQLAKRVDALPITRDYMLEDERALAAEGPAQRRRLVSVG